MKKRHEDDIPLLHQITDVLKKRDVQVGQTQKQAIWKRNKASLWYYPASEKKYTTPLFLVYSLINKPYILDLSPTSSMIKAYTACGYDVYLLDFGIPGYEDKDATLDYYICNYIQAGVRRALLHSKAQDITIVGYCLGGTLAAIYTAISQEPVKNLVLFVAPLDFSQIPVLTNWHEAVKKGELQLDDYIDNFGTVPDKVIKNSLRILTSPITFSSYLALIERRDSEKYVDHWHRFNKWVNDHVPFPSALLKQLMADLVRDNKLIHNHLIVKGRRVNLRNIRANLLVISTTDDHIVPEQMAKPIMNKVSSMDKTYKHVKGGHVSLALKGNLPDFFSEWLAERS